MSPALKNPPGLLLQLHRIELFDGKLKLYRRERSRLWQCSAIFDRKRERETTGEENVVLAKAKAEHWYLRRLGLSVAKGSEPKAAETISKKKKGEKTFAEAAEAFEKEYETLTSGERSPKWVQGHKDRLRLYLLPYFGELGLSEVTSDKVQDYRVHRIAAVAPYRKAQGNQS